MLYAAKCYWPSVTETNLEVVAERAVRTTASRDRVAYLDSLLFSADDLVLCFFEGPARTRRGARQTPASPRERLMDSIWFGPARAPGKERRNDPPGLPSITGT